MVMATQLTIRPTTTIIMSKCYHRIGCLATTGRLPDREQGFLKEDLPETPLLSELLPYKEETNPTPPPYICKPLTGGKC